MEKFVKTCYHVHSKLLTMLKIVTAKSQGSVENHLERAGWKPAWRVGEPTAKEPNGEALDDGIIAGKSAQIARIRSAQIPWRVSVGAFDAGLVGTDCLLDHLYSNLEVHGGFAYGRGFNFTPAYLALFTKDQSELSSLKDFPPGTIVMTERPHLTQAFLEINDCPAEIFWGGEDNEFDRFHRKQEDLGKMSIKLIDGGGAQQLQDGELLALVNETGRRGRNYGLREIAKICDIETLLLVNSSSIKDPTKREGLKQLIRDLDRVAISQESEGVVYPEGSLLRER